VIDWDRQRTSATGRPTFEIWLQRGGTPGTGWQRAVTIDFGPNLTFPARHGLGNASGGDPGTNWNWGAENRDGSGGQTSRPLR
jgi:hypothetical protein